VLTVTLLVDTGASDVWRSYWASLTYSPGPGVGRWGLRLGECGE
jgi:hypothetical protein